MTDYTVRPIRRADYTAWRALFVGYGLFYDKPDLSAEVIDTVWRWLCDPDHVLEGLLALDARGEAVGLAHIRACPRSLSGEEIGFLDDLYVAEHARGQGAADAIFSAIQTLAASRNWSAVRWLTQTFNDRGRAFYDRYTGGPSDFIAYHWPT